jgi:tetratricopeptide (TPR) repeat protein
MLERAIQLDPEFADAHACLALSHLHGRVYWGEASDPNGSFALAAAQRAVSLDPRNADAHAVLGNVLAYRGKLVEATAEMMTALQIDPNNADCWGHLAEVKAWEGNAVEGVDYMGNALRLNPLPPEWYYWCLGFVRYVAGQYEEAIQVLRLKATHRSESQRILAASLAQLGHLEESKLEAAQFLAAHPHFSIKNWASTQPFQHDADRRHFVDGYLKAGLPM